MDNGELDKTFLLRDCDVAGLVPGSSLVLIAVSYSSAVSLILILLPVVWSLAQVGPLFPLVYSHPSTGLIPSSVKEVQSWYSLLHMWQRVVSRVFTREGRWLYCHFTNGTGAKRAFRTMNWAWDIYIVYLWYPFTNDPHVMTLDQNVVYLWSAHILIYENNAL